MTDKDKEIIFKSIIKFGEFFASVELKQDIILNDFVQINFNIDNNNRVNICINSNNNILDFVDFINIVNELKQEKVNDEQGKLKGIIYLSETRKRSEIFDLDDNHYKVHKEYVDNMFCAKGIASGHGFYLKQLVDLKKIFLKKGILNLDGNEIKTSIELIEYLKSIGFENIESDFNTRNV